MGEGLLLQYANEGGSKALNTEGGKVMGWYSSLHEGEEGRKREFDEVREAALLKVCDSRGQERGQMGGHPENWERGRINICLLYSVWARVSGF